MKCKMKWIWLLMFVTLAKSEESYVNLLQYENITIADTNTVCSFFQNVTISEKCREQLDIVCDNSSLLMTILDASSKFPYPGLGYSSRMDFGNFDQCMTVDHSYSDGRILGKFCGIGLVIVDIFGNISDYNTYFNLGVCKPDKCTADDYNLILNETSEIVLGAFVDLSCSTVESYSTFSAGDIAVLSIFGVVILLMVVSTLYDLYLYHSGQKSVHPLCVAFSVLTNGRKLLHISKHSTSKEQIETFHGLRVISMMWVVAGHSMSTWGSFYVTNVPDVATWTTNLSSFHMVAAPLSVDTFFFISGFLLAFQYLKGKRRTLAEQVLSVPRMIIHRYLRLTPAMLMLYLVTITFFIHLGNGPLYHFVVESFADPCKTYWWRYFLYIQNYYDYTEMCILPTWYLSADMQMFLISPLILIPVAQALKELGSNVTMYGLYALNVVFTFLPMVISFVFKNYENEYDTHSRLINYFIGVTLGTFMRVEMDKPFLYSVPEKLRYRINLLIWSVIILGMLTVTLCYQDQQANHGFTSWTIFNALMRPAWCIGLSWITYSCYHGYGGFISWILCRPIFQVLGRLTYCIYLMHILVILYIAGTSRTKWYFNEYNAFYQFCGHYLVSIFVATFWTLAFESPLIIIEKYFLGGSKPRAKENQSSKITNVEQVGVEKN